MSIKTKLYNQKAETVGEIELSENIFGVKTNNDLIHQAYVAQLGNERQVLAHTKTKGEVRGGGKKPWRQKGTGRARSGSSRSPIWIGGGVTFGPLKDRNFKKEINKKMKQKAMFMVLSDRMASEAMAILDEVKMSEFKTKTFNEIVGNMEEKAMKKIENKRRSVLIIDSSNDDKVKYSGRNLVGVKIINLDNINIFDLLKYRNLIITKASVEKMEITYKK
ncbi:50S ribosomal protein L4 [Candidatus Parcubacteria bacterium]|nr:50S ribosomal protein L4 [Patescibacteria group bacterium]MBU4309497.1 50S ribosomal protein L4 [Patescibacteria group bacterium]MBU4432653.1 50S ribosomal protein L4 [Patescibacteria group bacterium]MBU4577203.1 50S ribosomal protein L4 [Patescibacteria group bacterium]MCG2696850.1 50S ribosomal protein L4 [Candidatus Parcubacteria bacterium]